MWYRHTMVVLAAVLAAMVLVARAPGAEEEEPAKIMEPEDGATVAQVEELIGWVAKGFPVVLVRPLSADAYYYVQPFPEQVTEEGRFATQVCFGRSQDHGVKFRVLIVVAPSRQEAEGRFKRGDTLDTRPLDLPASKSITVVRD